MLNMKKPQVCCKESECTHVCSSKIESGSKFPKLKLNRSQSKFSWKKPKSAGESLFQLRKQAKTVWGKGLEEIMKMADRDRRDEVSFGVPIFLHALCVHMLEYGFDYNVLVTGLEMNEDLDDVDYDVGVDVEAREVALMFKTFFCKLPDVIFCESTLNSLDGLLAELDVVESDMICQTIAFKIQNLLTRRVSHFKLHFLQYIVVFLDQLRTSNHNACPRITSNLSHLLSYVITKNDSAYKVAKLFLLNHASIFCGQLQILDLENQYDSDVSNSDSESASADDTFVTDFCDDEWLSSCHDAISTSSTSGTDEFQSPPISPTKFRAKIFDRSTDEFSNVSNVPRFSKNYSPISVTGLIHTYDPYSVENTFPKREETFESSAESSCISAEENCSELSSSSSRDADQSDNEEISPNYYAPDDRSELSNFYIDTEDRWKNERSLQRAHSHHSNSKPKRRLKRKSSHKEIRQNFQTSEEDDIDRLSNPSVSPLPDLPDEGFVPLQNVSSTNLGYDAVPQEHEISQSFSELLRLDEPVPSYRSSRLGTELEEEPTPHAWRRITPFYAEQDEERRNRLHSVREPNTLTRDEIFDHPTSSAWPHSAYASRNTVNSAMKLLNKSINSIKKKIRKFEEEFENSFGFKPTQADKMKRNEIKKSMSELSKLKKELKQMKAGLILNVEAKTCPVSLLRCQETTGQILDFETPAAIDPRKDTTQTYQEIDEFLSTRRTDANRPKIVDDMTQEQLSEEKNDVQRALLFYEAVHGRPTKKENWELFRPLYDRYRILKRDVKKKHLRQRESILELEPILEHVVMDFTTASPHRGSLKEANDVEDWERSNYPLNEDPHPDFSIPSSCSFPEAKSDFYPDQNKDINIGDLHALPLQELKEKKREAKEEKRRLRQSLTEFEVIFETETGRKMQREDRGSKQKNYDEYRQAKAKLRLLEALLSKHDT